MAKKITTAAQAVAKSRAKTGAKPVAITLRPIEIELLDELAKAHGGRKAAVVAGLQALKRGAPDPTPAQALRILEVVVRGRAK